MRRVPDAHFTDRYDRDADPWDLDGRWYERRKRALTMAALPRPRYRSAFEPGCANGLLTAALAARCDAVWAMDVAPAAVAATRRRCGDRDGVHVQVGAVPDVWPDTVPDLVVLSEVGYYLSTSALAELLDRCDSSMVTGGHVVAVHFRPAATEHLRDGDGVHAQLRARRGWQPMAAYIEETFRLDVFTVGTPAPASTEDRSDRRG